MEVVVVVITLKTFLHLCHAGQVFLVAPQQRVHGHDEAWGAESALRPMGFGQTFLNGMKAPLVLLSLTFDITWLTDPFHRGDG
jgi:hypothetical protein